MAEYYTSKEIVLNWADILVFSLTLFICLAIGGYYAWKSRKQQELQYYLLGGRRMALLPVALSMFVSFQSAVSIIGVPAEMYMYGVMFSLQFIGMSLSLLLSCFTIVPMMHQLKITSVYEVALAALAVSTFLAMTFGNVGFFGPLNMEIVTPLIGSLISSFLIFFMAVSFSAFTPPAYRQTELRLQLRHYLEMRFKSRAVRMFGTVLGMLQMTVYMGVTLYAPALSLYTVANVPLWVSIIVIGVIGTVYTAIGGMKSVVGTDVFQCLMIFTGLLAVMIKGLLIVGGFSQMGKSINEGQRMEFGVIDADPRVRHTVWGCLIGALFTWLPNWCSQSSVQRVVSLKSSNIAQKAVLLQMPMVILYGCFLSFIGLLMYTYYNVVRCDPLDSGILNGLNQLMPYFVFDILRDIPGLSGLFICTLFSGALSTISSGINSLSANTVKDLLGKHLGRAKISTTLAAKIAVVVYGASTIGIAYLMGLASGPVTQVAMSVFGSFGGPLAGLFFLGGLFPQANWIGGLTGTVISLILNMWISVGAQVYGTKAEALPPNPNDRCSFSNTTSTFSPVDISTISQMATISNTEQRFSFYDVSYIWYGLIGFILTVLIGVIASLIVHKLMPTYVDGGDDVDRQFVFHCCRPFMRSRKDQTEELKEVAHT